MSNTLQRVEELRRIVFDAIEHELAISSHCKASEGRISLHWPDYFDTRNSDDHSQDYGVEMYCYVLGPSRSYRWYAESFDAALDMAFADVKTWIAEAAEEWEAETTP